MVARIRLLYFLTFCCQAAWLTRYADFWLKKGFSPGELALLLSAAPGMMLVGQPVVGFLSDRIGHRKALVAAASAAAFCLAAHPFLGGGFFEALATAGAMALFFNATQPLVDSLALEAAEKDEAVSYGSLRFWGAAAWSATGFFGSFLVEKGGLEASFWLAAAAMMLTAALAFSLPENPKTQKAQTQKAAAEPSKNSTFSIQHSAFLLAVAAVSFAQTPIWNFYSVFIEGLGGTAMTTGWGLTLQGLVELPVFFFAARIIEKLGLRGAFLLALGASIVRMSLYFLVKTPAAALPIELLHGLSWSLFWVVAVELTDRFFGERRATGQSLLYAAYFGLGAIGGNFWAAFAVENFGIGQTFLVNAAVVGAVAAAVFWVKSSFFETEKKQHFS